MSPAEGGQAGARARVAISNAKGLHARAAARFVKLAGSFAARIVVRRGGHEVGGDSIMGLMMLAAGPGTSIEIEAFGPDAEDAVAALVSLVKRKFDED